MPPKAPIEARKAEICGMAPKLDKSYAEPETGCANKIISHNAIPSAPAMPVYAKTFFTE